MSKGLSVMCALARNGVRGRGGLRGSFQIGDCGSFNAAPKSVRGDWFTVWAVLDNNPVLGFQCTYARGVMSKTFKDFARKASSKTVIEVVANGGGSFEIILNQKVVRTGVEKKRLNDELCVKYGFCGNEFDAIMRELAECGRASVVF